MLMLNNTSIGNDQENEGQSRDLLKSVLKKLIGDLQYGWILLEWHFLTTQLSVSFTRSEMQELNRLSRRWMIHSRGNSKSEELRDVVSSMPQQLQEKLKEAYLLDHDEFLPIFFVQVNSNAVPAMSARSFSQYLLRKSQKGVLQKPPVPIPTELKMLPIIEDLTWMEGLKLLQEARRVIPSDTFAQKIPIPYFLTAEVRAVLDELFKDNPFLLEAIFRTWDLLDQLEHLREEIRAIFECLRVFHRFLGEARILSSLHPKIISVTIDKKELQVLSLDELVSRALQELQVLRKTVDRIESRLGTKFYGAEGYPKLGVRIEEAFEYLRGKQEYSMLLQDTIWKSWLRLFVLDKVSQVLETFLDNLKDRGSLKPSPFKLEAFLHDSQFKEELEELFNLVSEELGRARLLRDSLSNDPIYKLKSTI